MLSIPLALAVGGCSARSPRDTGREPSRSLVVGDTSPIKKPLRLHRLTAGGRNPDLTRTGVARRPPPPLPRTILGHNRRRRPLFFWLPGRDPALEGAPARICSWRSRLALAQPLSTARPLERGGGVVGVGRVAVAKRGAESNTRTETVASSIACPTGRPSPPLPTAAPTQGGPRTPLPWSPTDVARRPLSQTVAALMSVFPLTRAARPPTAARSCGVAVRAGRLAAARCRCHLGGHRQKA